MRKDIGSKTQRVPRSKIKVDFGDKGIRYVDKKLLQHEDDYDIGPIIKAYASVISSSLNSIYIP